MGLFCVWLACVVMLTAIPFIPLLFEYTRKMKWDRFVGEMSYPIYLVHPLMIKLAEPHTHAHMSLIVIPATLLAALLISRFIDLPIAAFRHRKYAAKPL